MIHASIDKAGPPRHSGLTMDDMSRSQPGDLFALAARDAFVKGLGIEIIEAAIGSVVARL